MKILSLILPMLILAGCCAPDKTTAARLNRLETFVFGSTNAPTKP